MERENQAQLLENLGAIEGLLAKAQITRGGNSERRTWAGSDWTDESMPNSTPNGTDYKPKSPIAHKALSECTAEEVRDYLEGLAKGDVYGTMPNPIAAEQEIMATLGPQRVAKSRCPLCDGTMVSKSNSNEACPKCKGHGYIWAVKSQEDYDIIKSIESKWNLNKGGPQGKNIGGGRGAADTTPPPTSRMRKEALDTTGEDVAGAEDEMDNPNASKGVSGADPRARQEAEDMDAFMSKAKGDDDEEEEEVDEEVEEKYMGKSISDEIAFRSFQTINRSQAALMDQVEELGKAIAFLMSQQDQIFELSAAVAKSQAAQIRASLGGQVSSQFDNIEIQKSNKIYPMAARAPKSVSHNVQIVEKSFADQAPGSQEGTFSTQGKSRFDVWQLTKGASDMLVKGLISDHRIVTRLEAGSIPDEDTLRSIEKHIDGNPNVLPKPRQAQAR